MNMKTNLAVALLAALAIFAGAALANPPPPPPGVPEGGQYVYVDASGNLIICTNVNGQGKNCQPLTGSEPPLDP